MISLRTMKQVILACCITAQLIDLSVGETPRLIPSAPFRMSLSPILREIDHSSRRNLAEATVNTLRLNPDKDFQELEVGLQRAHHVSPDNGTTNQSPYLQVRFFVLGSTRVNDTDDALRTRLNKFIESSFQTHDAYFLAFLSRDVILGEATNVQVSPYATDQPPATPNRRKQPLSFLDVALIIICGLILCGIIYMVVQHHKDRGYIESQRLRVLNLPRQNTARTNTEPSLIDKRMAEDHDPTEVKHDITSRESSIAEGGDDGVQGCDSRSCLTVPMYKPAAESLNVFHIKPPPETKDSLRLAESFDHKWVRQGRTRRYLATNSISRLPVTVIAEEDEEESCGKHDVENDDASDSSDDVFHLCASSASVNDGSRSVGSTGSTMAEWMKTIRVLSQSNDQNVSENYNQSLRSANQEDGFHGSSSSVSNTPQAMSSTTFPGIEVELTGEPLEHVSLEQSMVSSTADQVPSETLIV